MKKFYYKYKEIIWIITLIFLITLINIYQYINQAYLMPFYPVQGVNCFNFWYFVRTDYLGEILQFLSVLFITIPAISRLYNILSSGMYQNILFKTKYSKWIKKEILWCYIRGGLLLSATSFLIFIIGYFILPQQIVPIEYMTSLLYIPEDMYQNPYLYVGLSIFLNFLFSVFIINFACIIMIFIKKIYLIILSTMIGVHIVNYIAASIISIIFRMIDRIDLLYRIETINIFGGYSPLETIGYSYLIIIIYLVITMIILYFLYRKSERVIEKYE